MLMHVYEIWYQKSWYGHKERNDKWRLHRFKNFLSSKSLKKY